MQDVERVAEVVERTVTRLRELPDYAGRPAWDEIIREELTAAISAMTPDIWNAAIEAAAEACEAHMKQFLDDNDVRKMWPATQARNDVYAGIIRQLKKGTGNPSPKPPIL